ncbi:MAG: VOC family protein [Planctomycetota bacterium]|jgi:uncharacterized glyoxalase superfamily protein PhnB
MTSADFMPEGLHSITPYLIVPDPTETIAFLERAFDGREVHRVEGPGGRIRHAQVLIGDSRLMMGTAGEDSPPMPSGVYVYVPDVDAAYAASLEAGAGSLTPPTDESWGDRVAGVQDPAGNKWFIATNGAGRKPVPGDGRRV